MDQPVLPEIQKKEKKGGKKQIAFERMRIAVEKLQLARVKVTITLIALGFGVYKVFYARMEAGKQPLLDFPNGRHIGLFLIFAGFVALLLATVQHRKSLAKLKAQQGEMHYSLSLYFSYFILALSLLLFWIVIFRL